MGCVFGKFSNTPPRKAGRSQRHSGHVNKAINQKGRRKHPPRHAEVGSKRETKRHSVKENIKNPSAVSDQKVSGGVSAGGVAEEQKESAVAREEKSEVGDVEEKKIAKYEFVEGWPKWLVDNIPRNVLDTLVPKSADSYIKLGKVILRLTCKICLANLFKLHHPSVYWRI